MSNLRNRAQNRDQTPGNGIAVPEQGNNTARAIDRVNHTLTQRKGVIEAGLSKVLDVDVFMGRVMAEIRKTPDLATCSLPSLMGAVVSLAQLGLEPGPLGHAYLTPRQNRTKVDGEWISVWEVTLVIGYRGYIALGRRAGGMSIDADSVHELDDFTHARGSEEILTFRKAMKGDRGPLLGYWATAAFDGGRATHFMREDELHAHAEKYVGVWNPNRDPGDPPKYKGFAGQNFDAWCRKTVIRQMTWRLPQSNELARAMQVDEAPTYWREGQGLVTATPDGALTDDNALAAPPSAAPPPPAADSGGLPQEYDPTAEPGWQGDR